MPSSVQQKPQPPESNHPGAASIEAASFVFSQEDRHGIAMDGPAQQAANAERENLVLADTLEGLPSLAHGEMLAHAPQDWERYQLLSLLGKGGMGAVYKARDLRLGRIVALKFIRGDDRYLTERLLQEARAQARIEHDHICKVHEVGEINGMAYIAMQFIDGQPLSVVYRQMTAEDKVLTLIQVAEAVHAAHRLGIIHRESYRKTKLCCQTPHSSRQRPRQSP